MNTTRTQSPRVARQRGGRRRFVFGFPTGAAAQNAAPEVNAWVVIHPDDRVVIRIARSEMGQGTLTGLAQLVAEELACDWGKVTHRVPDARRPT